MQVTHTGVEMSLISIQVLQHSFFYLIQPQHETSLTALLP